MPGPQRKLIKNKTVFWVQTVCFREGGNWRNTRKWRCKNSGACPCQFLWFVTRDATGELYPLVGLFATWLNMQAIWNTLCHLVFGSSFEWHSLCFSDPFAGNSWVWCVSWNFSECVALTWVFPKIMGKPPKSSILIGFSLINHPFGGTPIFGNTHMFGHNYSILELLLLNINMIKVRGCPTLLGPTFLSKNVIMVLWFSTVCSHIAAKCIDSIPCSTDAKLYVVNYCKWL